MGILYEKPIVLFRPLTLCCWFIVVMRRMNKLNWGGGEVSIAWHRPVLQSSQRQADPERHRSVEVSDGASDIGLVLGHGAGYGMNARLLVGVAEALASRGITVVRFNFPYTEAGRKSPDPRHRLEECYRAVAAEASRQIPRLFLGGKSLGGRIASHIVADGFPAAGLVFLGYPLHPPGQPERLRDGHLALISVPMLFLQGTRDAYATPHLLHRTIESLPRAELYEVEGGDHSFRTPGRSPSDVLDDLADRILRFLLKHMGDSGG